MMNAKRLCLILFLSVANLFHGKAQTFPIPTIGSEWGVRECVGPHGGCWGSIEKYSGRDTLINNYTYQIWGNATNPVHNRMTRFSSDNRLYRYDETSEDRNHENEVLYYDFNLSVSDTFYFPYTDKEVIGIVTEVSLFDAAGISGRKIIRLACNQDPLCEIRWVEGMGDLDFGLFYDFRFHLVTDYFYDLVCYKDSSGLVFDDPAFDYSCDSIETYRFWTSTENIGHKVSQELLVFPNPVSQMITINADIERIQSIEILSLNGVVVLSEKSLQIDVSHLQTGMYTLKIETIDHSIIIKKLIKY